MAPRETYRLGHRLYLLESVAKIAATQETYHPRFVKRASRKSKCRRISNVGGLQPNRRSLRLRHSGGASLRLGGDYAGCNESKAPPRSPATRSNFQIGGRRKGPTLGLHNCDVAPRQLNEIAVSDRAAFAGLTQFSATHRDVHCKPLKENNCERVVRSHRRVR